METSSLSLLSQLPSPTLTKKVKHTDFNIFMLKAFAKATFVNHLTFCELQNEPFWLPEQAV